MNILISTFGVRGDVQPYLALAVGLQAAGQRVTLATSQNFTAWIESYGVHTHPTRFNFQDAMQKPEAQAVVQGKNFARQMRLLRAAMSQSPAAQDSAWAAMADADLVIQSPTGTGALETASQRGISVAFASPVPFTPTRAFPSFNMASLRFSLGGRYNLVTHKLAQRMLWNVMGGPMTSHLRTELGLRPWHSYGMQPSSTGLVVQQPDLCLAGYGQQRQQRFLSDLSRSFRRRRGVRDHKHGRAHRAGVVGRPARKHGHPQLGATERGAAAGCLVHQPRRAEQHP
jgi:UDP:flavonoid glycosyltransferase YjiC (YdhE family)